jgi:hypothetical protein
MNVSADWKRDKAIESESHTLLPRFNPPTRNSYFGHPRNFEA